MSANGDEPPPEYEELASTSKQDPGSDSDSNSTDESPSERKLYASGLIRVVYRRNDRNRDGLPSYRFSNLEFHFLRSFLHRRSPAHPRDRMLSKIEKRLKDILKKNEHTPEMACVYCTAALVEIGYQVVSVEGAVRYPTASAHEMTIQFTRPV